MDAARGDAHRRRAALRVVGIFVELGVTQVRLTGGEPLLRRSIVDLVAGIAALTPRPNRDDDQRAGPGPTRCPLKAAGLDRVNVSLDTVDRGVYETLTRRPAR